MAIVDSKIVASNTGELIDIKPSEINLSKLPKIPDGYSQSGLDVIIKLRKNS